MREPRCDGHGSDQRYGGVLVRRWRNSQLGIKEVDEGFWLVSFMRYDLGYIDLEQRTLQTIDNPFGTRLSPMS